MRTALALLSAFLVATLSGACARKPTLTAIDKMNASQLMKASRYAAEKAQSASGYKSKSKQKDWAIKGKAYAQHCIKISPQTVECHYWRAVNTGLYHQVKVIGYQDGIKQMLADCETMIARGMGDYDYAGPYRIQGEIYSKLPQTGGRPDSIVRDLDKADGLLRTAIAIAPDYPENRIAFAETLYLMDRYDDAQTELDTAKRQARQWRFDYSYPDWQKAITSLANKIGRKTK